ncbi:MAG: DUF3488 domain-containing protein [Acidobacteriota bacterium]|nr:DUF3488 domain-containing protein [Acidobacteriota bacterium]
MKYSRWTDHLPAWLAYGAVATTGIYEPWEVGWMAVPLVAAVGVEVARLDLGRWRRWLQTFVILVLFLEVPILRRQSGAFLSIVVHLLCMLMGLRLALPREMPQRRQLLLMGFLLFLTTAISTADLEFMAWAVAWAMGSSIVLLQQAWEPSAQLRRGPTPRPPYARSLRWTLACLILAAGFFVFLPRITLGLRPLPWSVSAFSGSAAGLSDSLDLGRAGRIAANSDIVMRIQPPQGMPAAQIPALADRLALLRGVVLEQLDGSQWKRLANTPRATWSAVPMGTWPTREPPLEMTFEPSATTILALPYGDTLMLQSLRGVPFSGGPGSVIRWAYQPPGRQYLNLFGLEGLDDRAGPASDAVAGLSPDTARGSTRADAERPKGAGGPPSSMSGAAFHVNEPQPYGSRRAILLYMGTGGSAPRRFADQTAPGALPPRELAERLSARLKGFTYTLDNPSGSAADPIADFLERSRAGHCEYFASSLALMLRSRGVYARVVNGYRLGPWISEGGYFLVTQNEAHSWVEYYDPDGATWRVADPTPPAPPNAALTQGLMGAIQRWVDAVRFRWDRHVVRFSGEDQTTGFDWAATRLSTLGNIKSWRLGPLKGADSSLPVFLGALLVATAFAVILWRTREFWIHLLGSGAGGSRGLKALRPLLRRTRQSLPPKPGETLRAWLLRLAKEKPGREPALRRLATTAESVAYGDRSDEQELRKLVKAEVGFWKK